MTELEDRIRDVLTDRSSRGELDPNLAPPIARRARRRQIGTIAVATVSVTALVVGVLGAVASVRSSDGGPVPASVGPLREVSIDTWTITAPADWYVLEFPGGTELQITNFDPGFTQPCFDGDAVSLPKHGVSLLVTVGTGPVDGPARPSPLTYDAAPSACRDGGPVDQSDLAPGDPEHWSTSWTDDPAGPVTANAMFGAESSTEDRAAIHDALATVEIGSSRSLVGTESTRLIIDTLDTPDGTAVLTVDRDPGGGAYFLTVTGESLGGGISLSDGVLDGDSATTMTEDAWGGVVWGAVTSEAVRAELQARDGTRFPATLVSLPTSLGFDGQQAVWGVIDSPTGDRVSTLLFDANGRQLNEAPPILEGNDAIATGTDPLGGPWTLTLERTADGIGLAFGFDQHGGGSGCCLSPLDGDDLRIDGYGSGGTEPSDITAVGSDALASVVFEAADGTRVDGGVYDMPRNDEGIPKVALVLVPAELGVDGTLIGYDANGTEIGREELAELRGEPGGPDAEVDAVWNLLRAARDAIVTYADDHGRGSLDDVSRDALLETFPDIEWVASGAGKPVPHAVAIRGVMPAGGDEATGLSGWTVVLVSATSAEAPGTIGQVFCIGVNVDDGGGGNFRYGLQDAATYEACRGGWDPYLN